MMDLLAALADRGCLHILFRILAALDSWDLQVVDIINHNLLWQAPKLEQKANSSMNVECFRPRAASRTFGTRLSSLTFGDIALSGRKQC